MKTKNGREMIIQQRASDMATLRTQIGVSTEARAQMKKEQKVS